jgi:hypothetical protein
MLYCRRTHPPPPRNLDVSVEQVAQLAQQNTLPEPTLDISLLSYSTAPSSTLGYGQPSAGTPATLQSSPAVAPPTDDPWTTGRFGVGASSSPHPFGGLNGGAPSSVAGSGLPSGWWKRQEKVSIQFGGQQGFVLTRYMVYGITTEVRGSHFSPGRSQHDRLDISAAAPCSDGTRNSRSCGTAWFAVIHSACCRNCLQSALGVSEKRFLSSWNAGETFIQPMSRSWSKGGMYFVRETPASVRGMLTTVIGKVWRDFFESLCGSTAETNVDHALTTYRKKSPRDQGRCFAGHFPRRAFI